MSNIHQLRARSSKVDLVHDAILAVLKNMCLRDFDSPSRVHYAQAFNLFITQQTRQVVELQALSALINERGYAQLTAFSPVSSVLPDYSYATSRLQMFVAEREGWDGFGGLPASPAAAADVSEFLGAARLALIQVPSLTMGGDGSVAVIWTNDEFYISADFDGAGSYAFFISQGDEFICDGISPSGQLDDHLTTHLKKYFTDDER
jgi:hypothetical protein